MLFIFRIFFASATASNSTLSQDTEETDEEDVSETYNIDYNDKNKWAYYDCYKPKKLTVFRTGIRNKQAAYDRMKYEGKNMMKGIPAPKLRKHIQSPWKQ